MTSQWLTETLTEFGLPLPPERPATVLEVLRAKWPVSTNDALRECRALGIDATHDAVADLRARFKRAMASAIDSEGQSLEYAQKYGEAGQRFRSRRRSEGANDGADDLVRIYAAMAYAGLEAGAQAVVDKHLAQERQRQAAIEASAPERARGKAAAQAKRDARDAARAAEAKRLEEERLRAELVAAEEEVRRLARALARLTAVNRDPHRFFENWP